MGKSSKNRKDVESTEAVGADSAEEKQEAPAQETAPKAKKQKDAPKEKAKAKPKAKAKSKPKEKVIVDHTETSPAVKDEPMLPPGEEEPMLPTGDAIFHEDDHDVLTPEQRNRHVAQVEKLAMALFASLEKLHHLGQKWERRLQLAARLHDVGWQKGGKRHHKTGMEMIKKEDFGISSMDRDFVALLVRYHRKAWPSNRQREFAVLSAHDQQAVRELASILRIADGFDYTHSSSIKGLSATVEKGKHGKGRVIITVDADKDAAPDIARALKKGDLFENVFSVLLQIDTAKQE